MLMIDAMNIAMKTKLKAKPRSGEAGLTQKTVTKKPRIAMIMKLALSGLGCHLEGIFGLAEHAFQMASKTA